MSTITRMMVRIEVGLLIVLTVISCSRPPAPAVASVSIPEGDQQLVVGDEVTLSAEVAVSAGASTDVTWDSDATGVATVDGSGTVAAVGAGTANVTATSVLDSSKSGAVTITVRPPPGSLLWSQQFGTSASDFAGGVAGDVFGNVFVTGSTFGALDGISAGGGDAFVSKFDSDGTPLWTQQFGTSAADGAAGVASDVSGNVFVAGFTAGALDGSHAGGEDAFVSKFDSDGTPLWTQQFGTSVDDFASGVVTDVSGNVFVTGSTFGALEGISAGGEDAFVSKFDSDGTPLWTQQFGTDATDRPTGVASDVSGNVFVTGSTSGALIGTSAGNADVFVLQLDSDGKVLWTHQFGTDTLDTSTGVASDASGNVIVAGFTNGALDGASAGSVDAFVRKLDGGGTPLWTQQFGTSASDSATGVASDVSGNVIVAGHTSGALEGSNAGSRDVFVRKLDVAGTPLWTQQFGTDASDRPTGVASDVSDNVIVAGHTSGALDGSNEGSSDVFVRAYAP